MPKIVVCPVTELPPGAVRLVRHERVEIGVFNVAGQIRAYRNVCPHAGAPVCQGRISGTTLPSRVYEYDYGRDHSILRCPWHGWEFDLETGQHLTDASCRLKSMPVEITSPQSNSATAERLEGFPAVVEGGVIHVIMLGGPSAG